MEETSISTVYKLGKVQEPNDQKQVGAATILGERKECDNSVSCECYRKLHSAFVHLFTPQLQKEGPYDAMYACSKNGWINEDIFMDWLQHFLKHTLPTVDDPILLVLDNHSSH
ncbi:hypothetical protein PR048_010889 [Dryococelus australis]|uniref:DDE-1 domain-containing protein n=1 Tax=Dryococelus australis TaxID=614101 RepID=A0ABQ9I3Z3_9NEOP|nr:hypothetical protein PR048_010889 [Dryococelus australis]